MTRNHFKPWRSRILILVSLLISAIWNTTVCAFQAATFSYKSTAFLPYSITQTKFKEINNSPSPSSRLNLVPGNTGKTTNKIDEGFQQNPNSFISFESSDTKISEKKDSDYDEKLASLDNAIKAAEAERERLVKAREEEKRKKPKKELKWEDWKEEDCNPNLVPVVEWQGGELKRPPPSFRTRTDVTRSDAGTLVIDITPQGITSGVLFNGAFSLAWFSAIVPATLSALSGGLFGAALFFVPFWAAGGFVAKQAIVDPFVSSRLSIGQFAWAVENRYGGKKTAATLSKQDGATEELQGARVECNLIVNDVPQFELCLYSAKGVTKLGLGLPEEELQKVATEINDFLQSISDDDRKNALKRWEAKEVNNNQ